MAKQFPRPPPGKIPTTGDPHELLDDPPPRPSGLGSLAGYRAGARARRIVFGGLIGAVVVAAFAGRWYVGYLEDQRRARVSVNYQLADGAQSEARPDEIVWESGAARLGLSRSSPGVTAIRLPDQVIRLADGSNHAQVKIDVRNGKTVTVEVLVGEVVREPIPGPSGPPAP